MSEIKELRVKLNMTQQEFADKFEIPKRSIENWETGLRKPPSYVFGLIKRAIECESQKIKK